MAIISGDGFQLFHSFIHIYATKAKRQPPWEERAMFAEIEDLLSLCPNLQLQHCKREANGVADWAAKAHGRSDLAHNWNIFPPFILQSLVAAEAVASGCNAQFFCNAAS